MEALGIKSVCHRLKDNEHNPTRLKIYGEGVSRTRAPLHIATIYGNPPELPALSWGQFFT